MAAKATKQAPANELPGEELSSFSTNKADPNNLRKAYLAVLSEPIPASISALIERLRMVERARQEG